MDKDKLVTIAIHTFEKAQILKGILENEGIETLIQNVNLIQPNISAGVRVRIKETDLPHALLIIESNPIFKEDVSQIDDFKQLKQVLIPIDFSNYSMKACVFGFNFAKTFDAEVCLFHAYFSPYFPGTIPITDSFTYDLNEDEALRQVQKCVHEEMDKFSAQIKQKIMNGEIPDVVFHTSLQEGVPEEEIIHYSREQDPLLVVMGTRGKNQKEIDLIGSVAAEVMDSSRIPVFAMPENVPFVKMDQVQKMAFMTNFNQRDLLSFDTFMRLMGKFKFKITFIHLSDKANKWDEIKMAGIQEYFKKQYTDLQTDYAMLDQGTLLSNIDQYIAKNNIDVLVIPTHKRNIFSRLFNPSIAHKVLFHADTPILVIPS